MAEAVTHQKLTDFARRLGEREYQWRLNYFRMLEYPLVLNLLEAQRGMKVLDVGGDFISLPPLWLAADVGCPVTVVDRKPLGKKQRLYVEELTAKAGLSGEQLRLLSVDAERLPFPDQCFDRVTAISVLEHLDSFTEPQVMHELGRVLKVGGRLVFSVPFNLGTHVEVESAGGEQYAQRHYSNETLNERLIVPSQLHFAGAVVFGEIDSDVGARYMKMEQEEQQRFAEEAGAEPEKYWREYYRLPGGENLVIHHSLMPIWTFQTGGIIAVALEKREQPPARDLLAYNPIQSYLANGRLTWNKLNPSPQLTIDRVGIGGPFGDERREFASGETIRFHIDFTAHREISDLVFRVLFHDATRNVVAGLRAVCPPAGSGPWRGPHSVDITIGMLNLLGGAYDVTIGAWDRAFPDPLPPVPFEVQFLRHRIVVRTVRPDLCGTVYLPHEAEFK